MPFTATHWLHWTPIQGTPISWAVRLVLDADQRGAFVSAITQDEYDRGVPASWIRDDRDGFWRWRGMPGYRGRRGTIALQALQQARSGQG